MLKALDFQPRMALVTRTISSAFSDLFHFLVLFSVIFIGYAFAGNQLFGHQFEGLSNLSNACQFLILILLSFDPTQMWVQASGKCKECDNCMPVSSCLSCSPSN
jgi:hypothetical protein